MAMNYKHYSYFAKRLPLNFTNAVQNSGCGLYFNPLINLKSFDSFADMTNNTAKIKYGVISEDNAVMDLTTWDSFGLAGRMQKPVLPFILNSQQLDDALQLNLKHAMNLAILFNYHQQEVTLEQLFMTLCAFSYKGDIRMRFKMENPDKVKNLV